MNISNALKWSFLSEIASKTIQPLVFIIMARLLTPEDFGVVAAATMVISFTQIFWEAGMGKALIQYQGERQSAANAAFWINNALGALIAIILIATSGLVAEKIFHDPRVALVLQVMSIQVLLSASISVHTALLQKDMHFKHLFWVRMATVTIPAIASIPLAWYGMGYWALVAGTLAGQLVQVIVLWKTSSWKPSYNFDYIVAKQLARFGRWVAASGLLAWFYLWADSLIVGMYLGSHELGLYRTGNAFVMVIFGMLFGPLMPVLYSHFSQVQSNRERIRLILFKVIKVITFISIPIAILIYANANLISSILFGDKWQGIELVIAVMALTHGYTWIVGANGEAYRAVGAPDKETKIMASVIIIYIIGYLISIQYGFEAFIWTRFSLAIAASSIHFWVAKTTINLTIRPTVGYILKIILICIPVMFLGHIFQHHDSIYSEVIIIISSSIFIISSLYLLERKGVILDVIYESINIRKNTNNLY